MLDAKNYGDFMPELLFHLKEDKSKWETRDDFLVYCDFDNALFQKVTGLNKISTSFNEVVYEKCEDNKYKLSFVYFVSGNVIYNNYFVFSDDVLGLFTEKDVDKPVATVEEKFFELFDAYLKEHKVEEVRAMLEEKHVDVWNDIVCNVVNLLTLADVEGNESLYEDIKGHIIDNELDADDLTDDLKDEVGREWAKNNLEEIEDIILDNENSYGLKDLAVKIINDYL